MFGVVPKALWQRQSPADELNRISMGCQSLVLRKENRVIIVDAGLGDKWKDKERTIYGITPPSGELSPLRQALSLLDLKPADVTDVIVTHLHFDHAGGLTERQSNGQLTPTFNNARHWVQAEHLDWARSPTEKDRGSFPKENIDPLIEHDLFSLTRGEEELFQGIAVIPLHGHTRAMQGVLVQGDHPVFHPADLLPMRQHLNLPYIMAYDINPLETLNEKKRILALAAAKDWLLYFEHEANFTVGRVEMFGGKYRLGTA